MQPFAQARSLAPAVAAGRVVLGGAMFGKPGLLTRPMGVDAATAKQVAWAPRMAGSRDLLLGLGLLDAARRGADRRPWLLFAALADAGDVLAFGKAVRDRQVNRPVGVLALVTAAAAVLASVLALLAGPGSPDADR
ncbi:MAG: hypothetical protein ACYDB7_07480 [Mycobacteriales bacterium]